MVDRIESTLLQNIYEIVGLDNKCSTRGKRRFNPFDEVLKSRDMRECVRRRDGGSWPPVIDNLLGSL